MKEETEIGTRDRSPTVMADVGIQDVGGADAAHDRLAEGVEAEKAGADDLRAALAPGRFRPGRHGITRRARKSSKMRCIMSSLSIISVKPWRLIFTLLIALSQCLENTVSA